MEDNRGFRNTAWSQQPTKKKVLQYMAIVYFSHILCYLNIIFSELYQGVSYPNQRTDKRLIKLYNFCN